MREAIVMDSSLIWRTDSRLAGAVVLKSGAGLFREAAKGPATSAESMNSSTPGGSLVMMRARTEAQAIITSAVVSATGAGPMTDTNAASLPMARASAS
ncbi:hypothetical protein ACWEQK_13140 [Streptomyces parvulus]